MAFNLPELPYRMDALAPHMSKETLEFHYGKHHKKYVDTLNGLMEGTEYASMNLADVIVTSREKKDMKVFNNASQVWNHTFFWNGLTPGGSSPSGDLEAKLSGAFGSMGEFKKKFTETAVNTFGSGWAWLVKDSSGSLKLLSTSNAEGPFGTGDTALLTVDVWEHAYYIDHRNARPKFLEAFWSLVNWEFVEKNFNEKNPTS